MGTIHHHAVIVTGWKVEHVEEAHRRALAIYGQASERDPLSDDYASLVGPIIPSLTNGYSSFTIHPDGSKEGWGTSDTSDDARAEFMAWMRDADVYLDWVEVGYGELGVQAELHDGEKVTAWR